MLIRVKDFFRELEKLFDETAEEGTLYITFKRLDGKHLQKAVKGREEFEPEKTQESRCIARACSSKRKISTIISTTDIVNVQTVFRDLLKEKMSSLKKKERKPKERKPRKKKPAARD
ncbi:putative signal recognition particle subunit SRP14 [Blattamonas nauphoetae]|uniref:Signal recognition particle 14 kDa protein n=1 Tax=Blattamonas nauphoetae TaxID=2049346 RepID=A0ABQ9XPB9_9EUKA|nr:putative signal recognition particle subunit SRP14 [Blattamonas nauphoetae]